MSLIFRKYIEREIWDMDSGKFQEFCLRFFPLENQKYVGLVRHGGTVDGKTRKGTPDLIKIEPNGDQIAVECGTEEGYWKLNESNISNSKPAKDGDKCLEKLVRPIEIVLTSTKEVPTDMQNSIPLLANYFTQKKIITYRFLPSQYFAEWLVRPEN